MKDLLTSLFDITDVFPDTFGDNLMEELVDYLQFLEIALQ